MRAQTKKTDWILTGPLYKVIISLALPIMLNNLIGTLYNLGDAFWVSRLGDVPVAAINFVWPVSFLTLSMAMGISIAGGSIISQYLGAGKVGDARETGQQLYVFAVLFGILAGLVGWFMTPIILKWMNAEGALFTDSVAYLRILFIEMPFLFMMNIFFSMNQAQGDTITPTVVNGTSALLNILLDPIFIFTFGLGIQGAAIATVLSKVPFALYGVYRMGRGMGQLKIEPLKLKIQGEKMLDLVRIGIPSSLGSSGVALGFILLHAIIVFYGDPAVAALGIGNRLNGLAFMPAVGIGAALSTIVGQNLGAGNLKRIQKALYTSIGLSLGFLTLTSGVLWFFAYDLVGIFSKTPAVLEQGVFYLRVLATTTWSIAFFNCPLGLFNGSGRTGYSMLLEAGRLWVIRMPLIVVLSRPEFFGTQGVWIAIGASNVLSGLAAYLLTYGGAWKKPKLKKIIVG